MKNLKVKWVPETFAVISLRIVPSPAENGPVDMRRPETRETPTKIIVIHETGEVLRQTRPVLMCNAAAATGVTMTRLTRL